MQTMNKVLIALATCTLGTLSAQVGLISGSPVPSSSSDFAAELIQVENDGSVHSLAELVPPKEGMNWGVGWLTISREAGMAIIIANRRMMVVDLNKGSVVKTCAPPSGPPPSAWINEWLLNTPSYGLVLAMDFFNPEERTNALVGWRADPTLACAKSSVQLEPIELSHIEASGRFAIGDIGLWDSINLGVAVDKDGTVKGNLGGRFLYGYRVPPEQMAGYHPGFAAILINNARIMVLSLREGSDSRALAFRKQDQTWHRVPLPAQLASDTSEPPPTPPMRAFGQFIAMAEVQPRGPANPESTGRSEWRKGATIRGPDVEFLLKEDGDVYPGRLHLYDVDTERTYMISTKQGDSEVLLVDNGTAYYRASDRLYSAPITESGIGTAKLLATDEAIRDAHWAYVKH